MFYLKNGFTFDALSIPSIYFLILQYQKYIELFSWMMVHIWLGIWGITLGQLTMGLIVAPNLPIFSPFN
jgi:hypothetical protein